jgi:exodeoxyribonuclease V alpha subunit
VGKGEVYLKNKNEFSLITLEAILENYIYVNDASGYCVVSLSGGIKAVGSFPGIKPGERLKLTGDYISHPKYGKQFKIESFTIIHPTVTGDIIKYLGSGLVKGIGPSTAEKIVSKFGDKTLEIMDQNIDRLLQIDGIGRIKLKLIKKSWKDQQAIKDTMIFFQSLDLSSGTSLNIYKTYGKDSIKIVQDNPYQLTYDIRGIGFKTADTIARKAGFEEDNPKRIKAGIIYVLNEAANDGHVYLPLDILIEKCFGLLNVDLKDSPQLLMEMGEKGQIIKADERVYLSHFYYSERNIENRITTLCGGTPGISEKEIKSIKVKTGFYSEEQLGAIINSLRNKILILTGGPGTGKTTTLKGIVDAYKQLGKKIMFAAPTGRAAKRISELIGADARTIHRLLEYSPLEEIFIRNKENPVEADLIVIDEVSMIDTILMNSLVNAVDNKSTLMLVGDSDQLPSVGPGNILNDLIKSGKVPTTTLTKIFRQAEMSRIVVNAHKINKGEFPDINNSEDTDFFFIREDNTTRIPEIITDLCVKRLPGKYGFNPMTDIQVLTPMYKGDCGADNLNFLLQDALNKSEVKMRRGIRSYKTGDKVMQLRNNYDKDIFNGDIGRISYIDNENQKMEISFNGKIVQYEFTDLDDITLAYAITVHKSQGSEYPVVVMPVTTAHYIMLQRNLLYTAVTRASKMMIIIGSKQALAMAVSSLNKGKRYTSLFKVFPGKAAL